MKPVVVLTFSLAIGFSALSGGRMDPPDSHVFIACDPLYERCD